MGYYKRLAEEKMDTFTERLMEEKHKYDNACYDTMYEFENNQITAEEMGEASKQAFEFYHNFVSALVEEVFELFEGDTETAIEWMEGYEWRPILDFLNI